MACFELTSRNYWRVHVVVFSLCSLRSVFSWSTVIFILDLIQTERFWSFWLHAFLMAFTVSHASLDLPSLCGSLVGCKIPAGRKVKPLDGKYPTCRRHRSLTVTSSAFPEGNLDLNESVASHVNFTPSVVALNVNWRICLVRPRPSQMTPTVCLNHAHILLSPCFVSFDLRNEKKNKKQLLAVLLLSHLYKCSVTATVLHLYKTKRVTPRACTVHSRTVDTLVSSEPFGIQAILDFLTLSWKKVEKS